MEVIKEKKNTIKELQWPHCQAILNIVNSLSRIRIYTEGKQAWRFSSIPVLLSEQAKYSATVCGEGNLNELCDKPDTVFVLHTRSGTLLKDIRCRICRICQTWIWECCPCWNTVAGTGSRRLFNDATDVVKVPTTFPLSVAHAQNANYQAPKHNVANSSILRLNKWNHWQYQIWFNKNFHSTFIRFQMA